MYYIADVGRCQLKYPNTGNKHDAGVCSKHFEDIHVLIIVDEPVGYCCHVKDGAEYQECKSEETHSDAQSTGTSARRTVTS